MTNTTRTPPCPRWAPNSLIAMSALLAGVLALGATAARAGFPTPCERTAMRAHRACIIDTWEEYNLTVANCITIADHEARQECVVVAGETRVEDREDCEEIREARVDLCDVLGEFRYDPAPLVDPANTFVHPDEIPDTYPANPWLSLEEGRVSVIGSEDEVVVILNTDETREIQGVECRIVAEVAMEIAEDDDDEEGFEIEYVPVEVTYDFFAQTLSGDVVYCGENTVEYEEGFPVSTDGTFIAGLEFAKSGYVVRAAPAEGDADRQEFLLEDAEDYVIYQNPGATPAEDLGGEVEGFECDGDCLQTLESTPIDAGTIELKYYLSGVGFVLAVPFEADDEGELEWTGEREELLCRGDSLDILDSDACGIDDPEELVEVLCSVAGDWFCDD